MILHDLNITESFRLSLAITYSAVSHEKHGRHGPKNYKGKQIRKVGWLGRISKTPKKGLLCKTDG